MITVRPVTDLDFPRVVEHIRQLWEAHGYSDYDAASLTRRCREILEHCECYIIDGNNKPLAFASLQEQGDYKLVRHFSVIEARRGQGHGRQAFEALEAHAFPGRKSRLYASIEAAGPKAFWEKMGYHAFAYTMERKPEEDGK